MEPRQYTQHEAEQLESTIAAVNDLARRLDVIFDPKPIFDEIAGLRAEVTEQRDLTARLRAQLSILEARKPPPLKAEDIPHHPHREFGQIEERLADMAEDLEGLATHHQNEVLERVREIEALQTVRSEQATRLDEIADGLAKVRGTLTAQASDAAKRQNETAQSMRGLDARRLALGNGVVRVFEREPFKALKAEVAALRDLVNLHGETFARKDEIPVPVAPPPLPTPLARADELAAGLADVRSEVTKQHGEQVRLAVRLEGLIDRANAVLAAAQAESQQVFEREPFRALVDQVTSLGLTISTYNDLHAAKDHTHAGVQSAPSNDTARPSLHIHQYITRGPDGVLRCACGAASPAGG